MKIVRTSRVFIITAPLLITAGAALIWRHCFTHAHGNGPPLNQIDSPSTNPMAKDEARVFTERLKAVPVDESHPESFPIISFTVPGEIVTRIQQLADQQDASFPLKASFDAIEHNKELVLMQGGVAANWMTIGDRRRGWKVSIHKDSSETLGSRYHVLGHVDIEALKNEQVYRVYFDSTIEMVKAKRGEGRRDPDTAVVEWRGPELMQGGR